MVESSLGNHPVKKLLKRVSLKKCDLWILILYIGNSVREAAASLFSDYPRF
jgi:hypothetical protein